MTGADLGKTIEREINVALTSYEACNADQKKSHWDLDVCVCGGGGG